MNIRALLSVRVTRLAGWGEANAYLLLHKTGVGVAWIQSGTKDLERLSEKAKKHGLTAG